MTETLSAIKEEGANEENDSVGRGAGSQRKLTEHMGLVLGP